MPFYLINPIPAPAQAGEKEKSMAVTANNFTVSEAQSLIQMIELEIIEDTMKLFDGTRYLGPALARCAAVASAHHNRAKFNLVISAITELAEKTGNHFSAQIAEKWWTQCN